MDRYLTAEVAGPFVFGMVAFVIIGMVDLVFTLVDLFINNGVPLLIVLKLLIFKIPAILVLFFPMAVLFTVLIALIRLIKDSELTVLRAGGVAVERIIAPVVVFSILISLLSYLTNERVVPWANRISDGLLKKIEIKKPSPDILADTFFKESDGRYFYIRRIDTQTNQMEHVVIYETGGNFPRVITAEKARWDGQTWALEQGVIHKYSPEGLLAYQGTFQKMTLHVEQALYNYYQSQKSPMEMTTRELKVKIQELKKSGVESDSLKVAYHMKFSMPLACFIFALVGLALVLLFITNPKELWGVIVAVLVALMSVGFYFFIMATCRSLARAGKLTPFLGAWGPNILYALAALLILILVRKRTA